MDGRRRRGDKLNSIVFLDGIGHFEDDDDDFGSKGEERQKGPSVFLSSFLSLLPTFKWTFEILRVTASTRSVCPNRRPCDLTFLCPCSTRRRLLLLLLSNSFTELPPKGRKRDRSYRSEIQICRLLSLFDRCILCFNMPCQLGCFKVTSS